MPKSDDAPAPEPKRQDPVEDTGDLIFETLWGRVVEAWDEDKPHVALLDYAIRAQKLPEAAGRYRTLKDDATKGAKAQKKLDGIVIAATQMLMSMKTPARTKVPWQMTLIAGIVSVVILGWLATVVFHR